MGIPMGIPVGMGWVWGLKCHPHGSPECKRLKHVNGWRTSVLGDFCSVPPSRTEMTADIMSQPACSVLTTVTSQISGLPACHGVGVRPSGRLPSVLVKPPTSLLIGAPLLLFLPLYTPYSSGVARNLRQGVCKVVLPLPSFPFPFFSPSLSLVSSPSPFFPLEVNTARLVSRKFKPASQPQFC